MTATGTGSGSDDVALATVEAKPTISGINFALTVTISELGSSNTANSGTRTDAMEMMTVLDLDQDPDDQVHDYAIRFGYYVKGSNDVRYSTTQFTTGESKKDYWKYYSVSVSIPSAGNQGYSQQEIYEALTAGNFAFDVNVTADGAHDAVTASRAKFYAGNNATPVAPAAPGGNVELADGVSFSSYNETKTYYFGMYVDGEGQDFDENGAITPNGNFTVTVAAHS